MSLPIATTLGEEQIDGGVTYEVYDDNGTLRWRRKVVATDTTVDPFIGTNGGNDGEAGTVPAPLTNDGGKFLKSDGTWDHSGGDFLGAVASEAELDALTPTGELDWVRVTESFFVAGGLIEFEAGDYYWDGSGWLLVPALPTEEPLDICGVNEFIHNIADYHVSIAHEGAGGTNLTVNVNGIGATFENLLNATDNGGGSITFGGGANQNFNRQASTVESIRDPDEYFEFVKPSTGQFDSQIISITSTPSTPAHTATEVYKLRFNATNWTLIGKDGATIATGASEVGTYRIARTLYGFAFSRNGVEIHTSPEVCIDYNEDNGPLIVTGATGTYQVGERHQPTAPIPINNTDTTIIETGHNLGAVESGEMVLRLIDVSSDHKWQPFLIDIADLFLRFDAGETILTSLTIFDNDFVQIRANSRADLEAGRLLMLDSGREMSYCWSDLFVRAPNANPLFAIPNSTLTTTGVFQDLGDVDSRIIGQDGDVVFLEYGDLNRDSFNFLDGIAKAERKGLSANDIELQVIGGQLQIRDLAGQSTVVKAWYRQHINAGVIGNSSSISTEDVRVLIGENATALGSNDITSNDDQIQILPAGTTWNDLAASTEFEFIEFLSWVDFPGTGSRQGVFVFAPIRIRVSDFATFLADTGDVTLNFTQADSGGDYYWRPEITAPNSGTLQFVGDSTYEAGQVSVYGVRAQKTLVASPQEFAYPSADEVTYLAPDNSVYQVQEFTTGFFTAVNTETRAYSTGLSEVDPTWVVWEPLNATLPPSTDFAWNWYQDSGNFILNIRATNNVAGLEVLIPDAAYGELTNLNIGGVPLAAGIYQFKTNPITGLTTHLFTFGLLTNGQGSGAITADAPVPAGTETGSNAPSAPSVFSS